MSWSDFVNRTINAPAQLCQFVLSDHLKQNGYLTQFLQYNTYDDKDITRNRDAKLMTFS